MLLHELPSDVFCHIMNYLNITDKNNVKKTPSLVFPYLGSVRICRIFNYNIIKTITRHCHKLQCVIIPQSTTVHRCDLSLNTAITYFKYSKLQELIIYNDKLSDLGVSYIIQYIPSLVSIYIESNSISTHAVESLANMINLLNLTCVCRNKKYCLEDGGISSYDYEVFNDYSVERSYDYYYDWWEQDGYDYENYDFIDKYDAYEDDYAFKFGL